MRKGVLHQYLVMQPQTSMRGFAWKKWIGEPTPLQQALRQHQSHWTYVCSETYINISIAPFILLQQVIPFFKENIVSPNNFCKKYSTKQIKWREFHLLNKEELMIRWCGFISLRRKYLFIIKKDYIAYIIRLLYSFLISK